MNRIFVILVLALTLAVSLPAENIIQHQKDDLIIGQAEKCKQVGEEISVKISSPQVSPAAENTGVPIWTHVIENKNAGYICPHFSRLNLPKDAYIVVRDPEGKREWVYTDNGKGNRGRNGQGFWGIHVYGTKMVIELYSSVPVKENAVIIDGYARGFTQQEMGYTNDGASDMEGISYFEAICGSDDSQWAKCYQTSEPAVYNKSKAVCRLLINGTGACTGWLVGSEGHVMTNNHCIDSTSDAANTNYEFMAEGSTCSTNCASWGACAGTVVATSSTYIKTSSSLDYTLVKLPSNPTGTYGYLQLRSAGPSQSERIYIPQHPAHWGKKIAVMAGSSYATIYSLNETPCSGGSGDVGYYADTQGGSSGSPVIAYDDHLVVALHHCANCPNRGVPIDDIISDLGSSAPNDAVSGGSSGNDPCTNCDKYTGTLSSSGSYDWHPNGNYYYSGAGTHEGWLEGAAGTDFDLYLYKWTGSWTQVAASESSSSSEHITYNGTSGYYVWKIVSYSGSGSYEFWLDRP